MQVTRRISNKRERERERDRERDRRTKRQRERQREKICTKIKVTEKFVIELRFQMLSIYSSKNIFLKIYLVAVAAAWVEVE